MTERKEPEMDAMHVLLVALLAFAALALAYSSVPKIRSLERRVAELERKMMGKSETLSAKADGADR
jgi:hypothetical protein